MKSSRRQQESPDSRESRLQVRRESARVRRQSECGLQHQQQYDVSRQHGKNLKLIFRPLLTAVLYTIHANFRK